MALISGHHSLHKNRLCKLPEKVIWFADPAFFFPPLLDNFQRMHSFAFLIFQNVLWFDIKRLLVLPPLQPLLSNILQIVFCSLYDFFKPNPSPYNKSWTGLCLSTPPPLSCVQHFQLFCSPFSNKAAWALMFSRRFASTGWWWRSKISTWLSKSILLGKFIPVYFLYHLYLPPLN